MNHIYRTDEITLQDDGSYLYNWQVVNSQEYQNWKVRSRVVHLTKLSEGMARPATEPTTGSELKVTLYGDVDCSEKVDIVDVIALNKNLMVGEKLTEQGKRNADVDNNNKIEAVDALNILKCVVELVTLPVE